jgi:hypothetical protein
MWLYLLVLVLGGVAGYFIGLLPIKAKLTAAKIVLENEVHTATVETQNVLLKISKVL